MKLSMASSSLTYYLQEGVELKTALQALRDCGFSCVDLEISADMLTGDYEKDAIEMAELLASLGLRATQGHAPMYNPLNPPAGIDCLEVFSKTLRYCKLAGVPQVVIHPGAREGNSREDFFSHNVAFYRSLIPAAEENGVTILIENIGNYADPYYLWTGADLREMIDRVGHPLFAACWDVGHANHFWPEDGKQYDSILALGDKLAALHVHENAGYFTEPREHHRIDMHTVPYSSVHASLNFDEILQALKDVGYRGTFNFETVFPAKKFGGNFVYDGKSVDTLRMLPLELWQKFNSVVYDMGQYMLEAYGLYEK